MYLNYSEYSIYALLLVEKSGFLIDYFFKTLKSVRIRRGRLA